MHRGHQRIHHTCRAASDPTSAQTSAGVNKESKSYISPLRDSFVFENMSREELEKWLVRLSENDVPYKELKVRTAY